MIELSHSRRFVFVCCCLVAVLAVPAAATVVPVEGSRVLVRTTPQRGKARFALKALDSSVTVSTDPTLTLTTLSVFGLTCTTGPTGEVCEPHDSTALVDLPGQFWKPLASGGFRYRDRSGSSGGVRLVVWKSGRLVVKAVGDDWPFQPDEQTTKVSVQLRFIGGDGLCAEFGGLVRRRDSGLFSARKAPAPNSCAIRCGDGFADGDEVCDPPAGACAGNDFGQVVAECSDDCSVCDFCFGTCTADQVCLELIPTPLRNFSCIDIDSFAYRCYQDQACSDFCFDISNLDNLEICTDCDEQGGDATCPFQ